MREEVREKFRGVGERSLSIGTRAKTPSKPQTGGIVFFRGRKFFRVDHHHGNGKAPEFILSESDEDLPGQSGFSVIAVVRSQEIRSTPRRR